MNSKGWLTDLNGNLITRDSSDIILDKKQLVDDEIPRLYNYEGQRYDI